MTNEVKRTIAASKKKIKETQKGIHGPESKPGARFRNSPGGRRLAKLRKEKLDAED